MGWKSGFENGRKREDEPNEQEEVALSVGGDAAWEWGIRKQKGDTEFQSQVKEDIYGE